MSEFETSLQRWILVLLVLLTLVVAGMNYWYRVLPAKAAREAAEHGPTVNERLAAYRAAQAQDQAGRAERSRQSHATWWLDEPEHTAANPPATETPAAAGRREKDLDLPPLTLPDGRSLGFAKTVLPDDNSQDWPVTDQIHPWIQRGDGTGRVAQPRIPSRRDQFIPLLLADGRLVLIGGRTPRDVVALEKRCPECADEYQPFGDALPSLTTDVFDLTTRTWRAGPRAQFPTDAAIRLRDGRVFKIHLNSAQGPTFKLVTRIFVEIADADFTRWERMGDLPADSFLTGLQVFESRSGVVLLFSGAERARAFHWLPGGSMEPWLEGERWSRAELLDEGRLQLTQTLNDFPPRTRKKTVELP